MDLGVVIALDTTVNPNGQGEPKSSTHTNTDADDRIPSLVVGLGDARGGGGRSITARVGRAYQRVGRVDLQGELAGDTGLSV